MMIYYSQATTVARENDMHEWQSEPIAVDGIAVSIHATDRGVILGKLHDGVYSSDILFTPEQAMELADALTEAAVKCLDGKEG